MFELPNILAQIAVITVGVSAVAFIQTCNRRLEDFIELQWKMVEMLAKIAKEEGVMDGFVTRSGRILRPRNVQPGARRS